MDAIQYIDVTPPYFALRDLCVLPPQPNRLTEGISCNFSREQPVGFQITHFDAAEIGRHLAILGSLVAARANPTKKKHYYLALFARLRIAGVTTSHPTLKGVAYIDEPTNWAKRQVIAHMVATTMTDEKYATLEVQYAILTEERLLQITRPPDAGRVFGTPWCSSERSPYSQPLMLRLVKHSNESDEAASAIISLHNISCMAGHFTPRPTAPIAILASNALGLVGLVVGVPFLCEESVIRCRRLVVGGEVLKISLRRVGAGEYSELPDASHIVELVDEQVKHVGSILLRVKRCPAGTSRL